jgi:hypothetical protein
MKILNQILLLIEILICLILLSGQTIAFGHGEADFFYFCLFYLGITIHLIWTIFSTAKNKNFTLTLIIFSILTLSIISKATIFRGTKFPWDGDIFVNHGRLKPNTGNNITYTIISTFRSRDSTIVINLPDPEKKYLSTLLVSDPECTGCNDCVIESGKVKIPDTLKRFMNDTLGNDIILLEGKSPYDIQDEAYVSYKIKGQITGIKDGKIVFYVSDWTRR